MTANSPPSRAGWHQDDNASHDLRWWTGREWADAYWAVERPTVPYLPDARRWNVSNGDEPRHDVVGENWNEIGIVHALGERPPLDDERVHYCEAELVCEPDNPHDENAVGVRVDGHLVGHLARETAAEYCAVLQRLARARLVLTVACRIWAVTRRGRDGRQQVRAAVRIALPPSTQILPTNPLPTDPLALVPRGRIVQLTKEEDHRDVLQRVASADAMVLTLHALDASTSRTSRRVVEARLDGERVGQLSPKTSTDVLPLVDRADAQGVTAGAWASLRRSGSDIQVTLSMARPETVSAGWPSSIDFLPKELPDQPLPPAYVDATPLPPPPAARGLGLGLWLVVAVALLTIGSIPYAGPALAVIGLIGVLLLRARRRRSPPRTASPRPTVVTTAREISPVVATAAPVEVAVHGR